ncbi:SDH family Clp fold serine proteinase [Halorubrum sp. SY-15]|uniref:SDH family Clp fold serine proteinase n=1 Tax=Halorubrum sp. SY-15 TaxID=3402277 RepID=UPI003EB89278
MPSWGEVLEEIKEKASDAGPHDTLRREYLSELADYTERDVILYSSGWTHLSKPSADFSMTDGDIQGLMEVIYQLERDDLDLILHTPGGTPSAAEAMVDYLRKKYEDIRIIVPHAAMSAGTMMCCAADEIVMGKHSSLGPIDPQITVPTATGRRSVPAQAVLTQFEQAKEEIKENQQNLSHWTPIIRQYGPSLLTECEQALSLSEELVLNWAESYMLANESDASRKAAELASRLSDWEEFKTHSRPLSKDTVEDIGFKVQSLEDDQQLQELVLSIYHITSHTHVHTETAKIIENHAGRAYMSSLSKDERGGNGGSGSVSHGGLQQPPPGPPQPDDRD